MRTFIALWPTPEVVRLLEALPRPVYPTVRWTDPDQWHVTLRFLGDLAEAEVDAVAAALGTVAETAQPVHLVLGPQTERLNPSLLVVPATGAEDLALAVRDATGDIGRPAEDRPFQGHITLARGRRRSKVPTRLAGTPLTGAWTARELTLVQSRARPGRHEYEVIAAVSLGAPVGAADEPAAAPPSDPGNPPERT